MPPITDTFTYSKKFDRNSESPILISDSSGDSLPEIEAYS